MDAVLLVANNKANNKDDDLNSKTGWRAAKNFNSWLASPHDALFVVRLVRCLRRTAAAKAFQTSRFPAYSWSMRSG